MTKALLKFTIAAMKKEIKKGKKEAYTENQVAALLENIGSKFDILSDGQKTLDRKMGGIETNQAATLEKITRIEIDVRFIKNNLKAKVDQEELQALERRVAFLEEKITPLTR
ncbi:MAG: hypothetical protein KKC11_04240 [Candidatus Omnitrophica bacterium]|nr:hypothetical protein [Candidatus Omnitrophota bacterium]